MSSKSTRQESQSIVTLPEISVRSPQQLEPPRVAKSLDDLKRNPMMRRIIQTMESGQDVGHYGRFIFTVVASYFIGEKEITDLLKRQPEIEDSEEALGFYLQVASARYVMPTSARIRAWDKSEEQKNFPLIIQGDRNSGNLYREIPLPQQALVSVRSYWREAAVAYRSQEKKTPRQVKPTGKTAKEHN